MSIPYLVEFFDIDGALGILVEAVTEADAVLIAHRYARRVGKVPEPNLVSSKRSGYIDDIYHITVRHGGNSGIQ